jgi:AcrR family transcriptional regulator
VGKTVSSPSAGPAPLKVRTPNAERSARTRLKILTATIDCLYEVGYDQTSTVLVTKRAGVSRGSMLHHFPSKADLIMAASEHIVSLRRAARDKGLAALPTPKEQFLALIDIFWGEYTQRTGIAKIEIMLGSRSDPQLGPRFAAQEALLERSHRDFVLGLLRRMDIDDEPAIQAFVELYVGAVRGLAIKSLLPGSSPKTEAAIALLKRFQAGMLEDLSAKRPIG